MKRTKDSFIAYKDRGTLATQFKLALLLKKYRIGIITSARYLGCRRSLIQSWRQRDVKHPLANYKVNLKIFQSELHKVRRKLTEENLNYFLAKRLVNLGLTDAYISRKLNIPTSTIRSWRLGSTPKRMNIYLVDKKFLDQKIKKIESEIAFETSRKNLIYYLALKFHSLSNNNSRRKIGSNYISKILSRRFNLQIKLSPQTIVYWVAGKRKPWNAFPNLTDEGIIEDTYKQNAEYKQRKSERLGEKEQGKCYSKALQG